MICLFCNYDLCDFEAVDDKRFVADCRSGKCVIYTDVESLDGFIRERAYIYQGVYEFYEMLADINNLAIDHDVLYSLVQVVHSYGVPRCICNLNRLCPCHELVEVIEGKRDRCTCGLFKRKNTTNPMDRKPP